jgi:DNA-binding GntR family transcriptional regulator
MRQDGDVPSPNTAWQRVARDIADRIRSGETAVGTRIATHQQLVERTGTSLGSVKRAIEHLQQAGVLEGVQGAGVFVQRVPTDDDLNPQASGAAEGSRRELLELRARVQGLERSDAELRETVGLLQAHLLELYARMGQPYPHPETPASKPRRRGQRAANGYGGGKP